MQVLTSFPRNPTVQRLPCLLTVLLAPRAEAVQMDLSTCALYGLSGAVLVGEVSGRQARWAAGSDGGIETVVDVWVVESWKGTVDSEWVEVVLPGGEIDGLGLVVEDVPSLEDGLRYVLFLVPSGPGAWSVVGGERGAVPVRPGGGRPDVALQQVRAATEACDAD